MSKIIMDMCPEDRRTKGMTYSFRTPKDVNITLVDIHNFLMEKFGGGTYLVVVNANDGELLDKISCVDAIDVGDIEGLLREVENEWKPIKTIRGE